MLSSPGTPAARATIATEMQPVPHRGQVGAEWMWQQGDKMGTSPNREEATIAVMGQCDQLWGRLESG